jgi:peptidoglycan hydrolase-like protein with peptidoglycan-binding domain
MVRKAFPVRVVVSILLAFAVVGGVVAAGAALRDDGDDAAQPEPRPTTTTTTTLPPTTTTTLPPTTTTTLPAFVQPAAWVAPPLPPAGLRQGSSGPEVAAYQQRLVDLKFDPGPVDGSYGQAMAYAVEALQKMHGMDPHGNIYLGEALVMSSFQYSTPLHPLSEPNRTEIDVAKQVITLYENSQVRLISTTSTASGESYCFVTPKEAPTRRICEIATTPSGRFQYYLFREGWDDGDLGALYNPYYYQGGRAIHGYDSVPAYPASHGCARIPMHISEYWHTLVHDGDAVYVDGGPPAEQILSSTPV